MSDTRTTPMKLTVIIDGATEEELRRGHTAAMAVFNAAGVTPYEAANAAFFRSGGRGIDGGEMTKRCAAAAHAWDEAQYAAAEAACAGWPKPPAMADFKLID